MHTVRVRTEEGSPHRDVFVDEAKKRGYAITFTPTHIEVEVPTPTEILALGYAVGKRLPSGDARRPS